MAKNSWFNAEAISAIVTPGEDGRIEIKGAKSSWLAGIAPPWISTRYVRLVLQVLLLIALATEQTIENNKVLPIKW